MISASCPSCGAPLTFRSAAVVTAVCPQCQSTVERTDDAVRKIGEVAAFVRELSPIRVGARGRFNGRGFEVAGVVRRARAAVRWNEWYITFDDGADGWLGESNGQTWIFPEPSARAPVGDLQVSAKLSLGGKTWTVAESASAVIVAAEGQLPFVVFAGRQTRYADLRRVGGEGVGTIDYESEPPQVWLGVVVSLVELRMEGLRPFAGWSDPVLTAFAGPELTATQALTCAGCGASTPLRAPGASLRRICEYCGAVVNVDAESGAPVSTLAHLQKSVWNPPFPLGTRTTIAGVEWEIIGAMRRCVTESGINYPWDEYLLHNPWRGFRWLVESNGHLNVVDLLSGSPAEEGVNRVWAGTSYTAYQSGLARVMEVVGEFTWEVARGDEARTYDYVAPPRMLSRERTADETTWALGTYLPWSEVGGALAKMKRRTSGVGPNEPNPADDPKVLAADGRRQRVLGILSILAIIATVAMSVKWGGVVHRQHFEDVAVGVVSVSDAFTAEGPRGVYHVGVTHRMPGRDVIVSVLSVDQTTAQDVVLYSGENTADIALAEGDYVARVEVRSVSSSDPSAEAAAPLDLQITRSAGGPGCVIFAIVFGALTFVLRPLARASFEQRRWANAGFSESS